MKSVKKYAPYFLALVVFAFVWNSFPRQVSPEHGAMSHYSKKQAQELASTVAELTGGSVSMVGGTGSMGTLISNPSFVVVAKDYEAMRPGYVAIYVHEGIRIIHRAEYPLANTWRMKGDANSKVDEGLMTEINYVGTVIATIPYDPDLYDTAKPHPPALRTPPTTNWGA